MKNKSTLKTGKSSKTEPVIYIAVPYTNDSELVMEYRSDIALEYGASLLKQKRVFYNPIPSSHPYTNFKGIPQTWKFWSRFDKPFLDMCGELHVLQLPGWKESVGVQAEIKYFKDSSKPIVYIDDLQLQDIISDQRWYTLVMRYLEKTPV